MSPVSSGNGFRQTMYIRYNHCRPVYQARREGGVGGKLPQAPWRLGAPQSARNIMYAKMYHFKKSSKIFSPDGPRENVWGPRKSLSSGPTVVLDGPAVYFWKLRGCFPIDRWIREAIHIRKGQDKSMNRDEGSYQLPHIYDYLLSATATPGGQSFWRRQQQLPKRQQKQ